MKRFGLECTLEVQSSRLVPCPSQRLVEAGRKSELAAQADFLPCDNPCGRIRRQLQVMEASHVKISCLEKLNQWQLSHIVSSCCTAGFEPLLWMNEVKFKELKLAKLSKYVCFDGNTEWKVKVTPFVSILESHRGSCFAVTFAFLVNYLFHNALIVYGFRAMLAIKDGMAFLVAWECQ